MQYAIIKILRDHYAETGNMFVTVRYLCNAIFSAPEHIVLPGERYMSITRRELHRMRKAGIVEQVTPVLWRLSQSGQK
jgi:hypothetical protein